MDRAFGGVAILIYTHNVFDAAFQFGLCVCTLTSAGAALLEIAVLIWSVASASAAETRLLFPRRCGLLSWRTVVSVGRWHAEAQALLFFASSLAIAVLMQVPLSCVAAALVATLLYALAPTPMAKDDSLAPRDTFIGLVVCLLVLLFAAYNLLGGGRPRAKPQLSPVRFQLLTLNLKSLHDALVLNLRVARFLAEKAATSVASAAATLVAHRV